MKDLTPPEDDSLYIPLVGPWSADKHHYLFRYIDIFTAGMKYKHGELHYVDLFANAGIERIDGKGLQWGSPLLGAQAPNQFARLHFCERNVVAFDALQDRIRRFPQPQLPQLICGDANDEIERVSDAIPIRDTLTLAFIDPYGLHAHFATLEALSAGNRKVDYLIIFPDRIDAIRNFDLYDKQEQSNLDLAFGSKDWRTIRERYQPAQWGQELRLFYQTRMATLGYNYFDYVRICRTDGVPLYVLLFCSRHERVVISGRRLP